MTSCLDWRFFVVRFADDVRDVYAKKLPKKSQRKAIVNVFCRADIDRLVNKKWMKYDQYASHINNDLPLVGASVDITLAGADLPLTGCIRINLNDLHCAIQLDS